MRERISASASRIISRTASVIAFAKRRSSNRVAAFGDVLLAAISEIRRIGIARNGPKGRPTFLPGFPRRSRKGGDMPEGMRRAGFP
jgi:hypothetical protein